MECIEAKALKKSFLKEIGMKSTQQAYFDEVWCVAGINNVSPDDFSVDDLLDLSDKDFKTGFFEEYSEEDEDKDILSVSSQDNDNSNLSNFSGTGNFVSLPSSELPVPVDDMENLEWLSQIVDDSVSELPMLCPAVSFKEKPNRVEPVTRPAVQKFPVLGFSSPVPKKTRSKRSRTNGSNWSIGSLSLTESSSTSSSSYDSSVTSPLMVWNPVQILDSLWTFGKPPAKKQKRNTSPETGSQTQRRCSHCQVQKTPQWRTGPLGPKTLCNACGVRFKSGRLFPEYRPACSPTFSGEVHSNSHRKVLEMRRQKETSDPAEPSLSLMGSSF